jgi:hypothetical protein
VSVYIYSQALSIYSFSLIRKHRYVTINFSRIFYLLTSHYRKNTPHIETGTSVLHPAASRDVLPTAILRHGSFLCGGTQSLFNPLRRKQQI